MKKRVNPDLLRNAIFPDFLNFNNIVQSKDTRSLMFFQDIEIKKNLPVFLDMFGIVCVDCKVLRTADSLNIYLNYYNTENIYNFKEMYYTKGISRLNFHKFRLYDLWFNIYETEDSLFQDQIINMINKFQTNIRNERFYTTALRCNNNLRNTLMYNYKIKEFELNKLKFIVKRNKYLKDINYKMIYKKKKLKNEKK